MNTILRGLSALGLHAARIGRWLSGFPPSRLRRPLLAFAGVGFLFGATYFGFRLDIEWHDVRWSLIALAMFFGVPLTAATNAVEFRLSAILLGSQISFKTSLKVAVLATAANLLPLPGGALIKTQALQSLGHTYRKGLLTTGIFAASWLGIASLAASSSLLTYGKLGLASGLALSGATLLVFSVVLLSRYVRPARYRAVTLGLFATETAAVLVSVFRLYAIMAALGKPDPLAASIALAFAGVLSSVIGIFPGGLGLREWLSAALAPVVGATTALGFLVSAIDRTLGLALHAPLALYLFMHPRDGSLHKQSQER